MAYLTFAGSEDKQNTCFNFIGTTPTNSKNDNHVTNTISLLSPSGSSNIDGDTCSFYSGPSESTILAFGESNESCGIVAYSDSGYSSGGYSSGGESCGIVASSSSSSGSSFSGGCCSYSC